MERRERFYAVQEAAREHVGQKVRLTFPNGAQKAGTVRDAGNYLKLDSSMFGGENTNAVRLEVKRGQRFAIVAEWPVPEWYTGAVCV